MSKQRRECPRCHSQSVIKSGILNDKQRFKCKGCNYFFTVDKIGKQIDEYYVIKALQLYLDGISLREIERLLGVSHVSVMNWIKKYGIKRPSERAYHPTYKILNHHELIAYISQKENTGGYGMIITEVGDKFMVIKWERFR